MDGTRSYKVERAMPDGLSYAKDLISVFTRDNATSRNRICTTMLSLANCITCLANSSALRCLCSCPSCRLPSIFPLCCAVVRLYLHVLFHHVFYHSFAYGEKEEELWDLAADAAVENVILEMGLPMGGLDTDAEAGNKLHYLKEDAGMLTAERIYRYLKNNPISRI